jgi:cytochrome c553
MNYWTKSKPAALSLALGLAALRAPVHAEDAATGKQLFMTRTCFACHGKNGAKAIMTYPNLAGQNQAYLFEQMKDIGSGRRVSGPDARGYPRTQAMKDVMSIVSDQELKAIAAWLSTLPPPPTQAGDAAKAKEGAALYAKSSCVACHGAEGVKPLPGYPIVGGQKKNYLVLQIKEIRDGVRTNGPSKIMRPMVAKFTDADVDAIGEYLSQVNRTSGK